MEKIKLDKFGKRLLKLVNSKHIDFVENAEFNFERINSFKNGIPKFKKKKIKGCGTVGCKMYLFPFLWKEWQFKKSRIAYKGLNAITISLMEFFDLRYEQAKVLFYPSEYLFGINGVLIKSLPANATEEQVNENLLKFIKAKYII